MDFFFCLPIMIGCPTKIKPDGDQSPRICPRCHNGAMFAAKSRTWFEFCFVPLIPMKSRHVWMCGICQLQVAMQPGWEPPVAHPGYQHPGQTVGGPAPNGYGYQPTYTQQQK
ncbi:hypothetical protein SERLA73DRAFT_185591 [Serpula lacrymans var. lacrymans S7.3]|uniref:Zinc-ribbon 15 domain-containing protein n=2 Tax=Serpula lacrymans var. lacrymans TaxID=341189 RepID=F8Q633_SERL3|nr:uncharacterized protein SERLADRAFT_474148 [Serpula lacrymans var. lacrymans S7.9]EGN96071.1 hypothetical protein SERLA73DRAFT_185591 [Serpula lacrymans var. lacrymans S7.3]EGO21592.1 hypothetical protein SERLADRAFT_474148 [Serpula lacrymans var. lacrymans S7.9]